MTAAKKTKPAAKAAQAKLNTAIRTLEKKDYILRSAELPGTLWRSLGKGKLSPTAFITEGNPELKQIMYSKEAQEDFLIDFEENPTTPGVYMVCSSPNNEHGDVVAAHLLSRFIEATSVEKSAYWLRLGWGKFDTRIFNVDPAFVVVSSISPITTNAKLEFAQEIIDVYSGNVPVVIVGTGMNPIAMSATKLFRKPRAFYYYCSSLVKNNAEVI